MARLSPSGTGTIGFQIEQGKESRVGGWGFPHGDEGGGAWLGLEAVRLTLQWLDGRASADPLLAAIYSRFDNNLNSLEAWAIAASATEFGEIAPLVVEDDGHPTPLALLLRRGAAHELDRIGAALDAKGQHKLPVCLLGGLLPSWSLISTRHCGSGWCRAAATRCRARCS